MCEAISTSQSVLSAVSWGSIASHRGGWETGSDARAGIAKWVEFYNHKRRHGAHGGRPPAVVYCLDKEDMQPDQQKQRVA